MEPQFHYIQCANQFQSYKMFYTAWGDQAKSHSTLLCLHALNRNSRDWDYIAQHFSQRGYYVIAPDIVGRGNSDHLNLPNGYDMVFYINDIIKLIAALKLHNINVIGSSMGGLIGMGLTNLPTQILRSLILNDIGAEINSAGIDRILNYSKEESTFKDFSEAYAHIKKISEPFGNLPDEVWSHIVKHSIQPNILGRWEFKRDPKIMFNFAVTLSPVNMATYRTILWGIWEKISIPTLIIRGANSDLLTKDTVIKMCNSNAKAQSVEIPNAGHAPFLYNENHFNIISNFLESR